MIKRVFIFIMLLLMATVFLVPTVLCQSAFGRAIRGGRRNLPRLSVGLVNLLRRSGSW